LILPVAMAIATTTTTTTTTIVVAVGSVIGREESIRYFVLF
jgi:hypothetical protein